ncbi:Translin-associated protein X [Pitangus sulphuratus]|nr:Translin-associated protein X [Pitangus sulphuratus]
MASNDKVTKGIFLVVSLELGKEGHVKAVEVKVCITMNVELQKNTLRPGLEDITQTQRPLSPELWRNSKDCMCFEEDEDEEEGVPKGSVEGQNGAEPGVDRSGIDGPYYKIIEPLSGCVHGSGGFRKRKHDNFPHGQRREEKENVNPSSALMTSFKSFQLELDTRHDKYERLVKLSRDITIESKRTIFLLHRFTSTPNGEEILNESEVKLDAVRQKIKQVAQELIGEDMYQFHRAISPGDISGKSVDCRLQEYVEAVSFQYFIKTRSLISVEEINKQLIFTAEDREETTNTTSNSHDKQQHTWSLKVTPVDYLLGVADLTGELMRLCISSVGNGDIDTPFELSQFLRQIYDGFTYIGNTGPYEVSKKLYTLKQSLAKVENACYTLKVRGSEIPKHMLADVFSSKTELIDQDEGLP